jgi:hypothetical protein
MKLPNHDGSGSAQGEIFGNPETIGTLKSATFGGDPAAVRKWRLTMKVLLGIVGGSVGLFVGFFAAAVSVDSAGALAGLVALFSIGFTLVGVVVGGKLTPKVDTTFVGTEGLARFTRKGSRDLGEDAMRFEDAADLDVNQTEVMAAGVHVSTVTDYVWSDTAARPLFRIQTAHDKHGKADHSSQAYGKAAFSAWKSFRAARGLE